MPKPRNTANYKFSEISLRLFGDHLVQFRQYLSEQTYAENTIAWYLSGANMLARLMEAEGVSLRDLDEAQAVNLVARTGWHSKRKSFGTAIVRRFVRFLNEQGIVKPTLPPTINDDVRAKLRRDYETYLRRQRGLADSTIHVYWRFADRFLKFCFGEEIGDLSQVRSTDIVRFLQESAACKRAFPLRVKSYAPNIRSFFRYLFNSGKTPSDLGLSVPSVAHRYGARLPRHLPPEQVEILLKAVRSSLEAGRRNYAMILLLARLGLRAPEVVAMQLDDIDWRAGEIIVRGKGKRHDRLPLPPDVGKALADYIKLDRRTTSRAVFVRYMAPYRPLKDGRMLNLILKQAFAGTSLKPPVDFVGSHILRHSLAANLVREGASLEEIGDMLRHRSRSSTMLYARLDLDGLRSIAQPWPVAGGAK